MQVVGEGAPLVLRERTAQGGHDARQEAASQELPREIARERGHGDAVAPGDRGRRLLEGHEVSGPAVAVGNEDPAEARARERVPVVQDRVTHHALPDPDGARRLEGEGAEVKRGGEHRGPARAGGDQALGQASAKCRAA